MSNVAIVIPTYNELENIERLIKEIKKNINKCNIYIVDDTPNNDIGKLLVKKKIKVKYFHRKNKSGRGSAIIYGLKKASCNKKNKIFVEMDADFSHDPKELKKNLIIFKKKKFRFINCK